MSKLKIAQVAPIIERVPPERYGGTERVVHELTEALVRRGHDVTLFASGNSVTSARRRSVVPRSLREMNIPNLYGYNIQLAEHLSEAYSRQHQFDVIHDHNGPEYSLPLAHLSTTPTMLTMHGPYIPEFRSLFLKLKRPCLVGISANQAEGYRAVRPDIKVAHNGLTMRHYPIADNHEGYLLFVGRLCEEKGPHRAIEVAKTLKRPLVMAAKLDQVDLAYFRKYVQPHLSNPLINWIGEVNESRRNQLMSRALCLLHPISWEEPFGLTLIEAMACGCPVIGIGLGSIPELVKDGVSGYVVADVPEMIDAVKNIDAINRPICRQYALANFTAEHMADVYEMIYYRMAASSQVLAPKPARQKTTL